MQQFNENDSANIVHDGNVENAVENHHRISYTEIRNAAQTLTHDLREEGAEYIRIIQLQLLHCPHAGKQCTAIGPKEKE